MTRRAPRSVLKPSTILLGFGLGGMFDGILLHQILQWHHLLSLVPGERTETLEFQILADGLFHLLMNGLVVLGVILLWRDRRAMDGRAAVGGAIIGFGAWNVVDVIAFHWVLGIHNVRLDRPDPFPWDLGWLIALGVVPILAGFVLLRSGRSLPPAAASGGLTGLALLFLASALFPPPASDDTLVVFWPGARLPDMVAAAAAADGVIVSMQEGSAIMTIRLPDQASRWRLYTHGAALVSGAGPGGCLTAARLV